MSTSAVSPSAVGVVQWHFLYISIQQGWVGLETVYIGRPNDCFLYLKEYSKIQKISKIFKTICVLYFL